MQKNTPGAGREDPLRRACHILLWRVPLLLPLVTVVGVIMESMSGWVMVAVALAAAHALKMRRLFVCCILCGAVVGLSQSIRHQRAEELQAALSERGAATLEGTVVQHVGKGCVVDSGWLGVRVAVRGETPWEIGDAVRLTVEALAVEPPLIEGMFSTERWMEGQGICANTICLHGEKLGRAWGWSSLTRWAGHVRTALAERLMPPGCEDDMRAQVLCALVLGDKERSTADTLELFRRGGCMHAFAVSGLHVGLVAGILWLLLRLCRVQPLIGRYVLLGALGLYVAATGLAVPALRAYLMLAALMMGLILRRRVSMFNTWCFVALLILMVQPWQFWQVGFQLSFVVYAAICLGVQYAMGNHPWFGPDSYIPARIRTGGERLAVRLELFVRGAVVVSVCAWIASLPIVASQFHVINTGSYLTNIIIAPILPVVMFCGLATLVFGALPLVGGVIHTLAMWSAGVLVSIVGWVSSLPGSYLPMQEPAPPHSYALVSMNYGRSFAVLGNPGILVGDVGREADARFTIEPFLFHAGYTPALLCSAAADAGISYRLGAKPLGSGSGVRRLTTSAGVFTVYYPPAHLPASPAANAEPIIIWEPAPERRYMYMGNAAISTLEAIPPEERRADVLILGSHPKEPMQDLSLLREMRISKLILLPTAAKWQVNARDIQPIILERLTPESRLILRNP